MCPVYKCFLLYMEARVWSSRICITLKIVICYCYGTQTIVILCTFCTCNNEISKQYSHHSFKTKHQMVMRILEK